MDQRVREVRSFQELDELVAQMVWGWERLSDIPGTTAWDAGVSYPRWRKPDGETTTGWPDWGSWSRHIEPAWTVVQEMRRLGWTYFVIEWDHPEVLCPVATFRKRVAGKTLEGTGEHATPEAAICDAAIQALEAEQAWLKGEG